MSGTDPESESGQPHFVARPYVAPKIDWELVPFFREEAAELFLNLNQAIHAWEAHAVDPVPPKTILRLFHTFKGSANSIGLLQIGQLAGEMEQIMKSLCEGTVSYERSPLIQTITAVAEGMRASLEAISPESSGGSNARLSDLAGQIQAFKDGSSIPTKRMGH